MLRKRNLSQIHIGMQVVYDVTIMLLFVTVLKLLHYTQLAPVSVTHCCGNH